MNKQCVECGETKFLDDFYRREGQPYWVPPATKMARALEPLLPRVENDTCHSCFGRTVLGATRP